jgi:hypothetical protein
MLWDETTGGSALVNWHGSTTNDWGVLQGGECAQAAVNVNLSNQLVNDLIIDYTIGGDGYGDEPHIVEGEIILEYPLRWISLDAAYGTLEPDETDEIEIYLDSSEIPETAHSCNIIITTYSWDTKILPVTLTPVNNDDIPDQIPTRTILQQNYPNPFNPQTAISYSLAKAADNVSLKVYNTKGQLIKTLVNKPQSAGKYQKIWEGADQSGNPAASGVYLYKLSVDKNSYTRKMLLIK